MSASLARQTKIVATLGPSCSSQEKIAEMIQAGVDVFRINFSHGEAADHIENAKHVRSASLEVCRQVGILGDLQGPKIRIGRFANNQAIELKPDDTFILDAECREGNAERVGLDYKALPQDVASNDILLLDDGRIVLEVQAVRGSEIVTRVRDGGKLSNNKGVNRLGGGLSADALSEKDLRDIALAAEIGVDYLAVSFPRSGDDIREARALTVAQGMDVAMIAKIERAEAVADAEAIVLAADGIMVARGDLAVEVGDAAVPAIQKKLIRLARNHNRLAITATQMMETMTYSSIPTRAEVSDVANAVLDGSDAVMLSGETAVGDYPVRTVRKMDAICQAAEASIESRLDRRLLDKQFERIDQTVAFSAVWAAFHLNAKAILSFTQSGMTALWMSRINGGKPIYALTPLTSAQRRMSMYRGVIPLQADDLPDDVNGMLAFAQTHLLRIGAVTRQDLIIMTNGEAVGVEGGTNSMKIVRIG